MEEKIRAYFDNTLSEKEKFELLKEIQNREEWKNLFITYKNMNTILGLSETRENREENRKSYQKFIHKTRLRNIRHLVIRASGYAAAVLFLILSTYFITLKTTSGIGLAAMETSVHVPAGQQIQLTLQDGTNVWLNSQSRLTYPTFFSTNERRVKMEGEAFFDIAKDREKPFIVESQGVEMKVLGTQFNVYSYESEDYIKTSLLEGALHVYFSNRQETGVFLKPDEQVIIKDDRMNVEKIPHIDYFLWTEGLYSFENELLIDILKKLELYYDVRIVVKDPSIFQWEYTGKFRQRDGIDEILRVIQRIHTFHIEKDEEQNMIILNK